MCLSVLQFFLEILILNANSGDLIRRRVLRRIFGSTLIAMSLLWDVKLKWVKSCRENLNGKILST